MQLSAYTNATSRKYVCASEEVKLIGSLDGTFPDFGHHLEREMGGLWLHPIKLLDGFWLRLKDLSAASVDTWIRADAFATTAAYTTFYYNSGLGHTELEVKRQEIAPEKTNGLIVRYEIKNNAQTSKQVELEFLARTDLRPVWFSENIDIFDGETDLGEICTNAWGEKIFLAKDSNNPWFVAIQASPAAGEINIGQQFGSDLTAGRGVSASFISHYEFAPKETLELTYYISGSYHSRAECLTKLADLQLLTTASTNLAKNNSVKNNSAKISSAVNGENNKISDSFDFYAQQKQLRYEQIAARSKLIVQDQNFAEIYNWIKINTDWLILNVEGFGRGLAAGIPEYTWWFACDSFYALQGVLAMGDYQLAKDTLSLIHANSRKLNASGRIVHEITTNGACPNYGNTQETAQFIVTVWLYYMWTGDFELVEEFFPYMSKSVTWLEEQAGDGIFPEGFGIIEIAGLNSKMIDVAVYTAVAFDNYASICQLMLNNRSQEGDLNSQLHIQAQAKHYRALAKKVKSSLRTEFWDEEAGLFADAFTNYAEVSASLERILEKTPDHLQTEARTYMEKVLQQKKPLGETNSAWLLNRNWVINTPMEMGIATKQQAETALANLHTDEFIGSYGMYLNAMYKNATMTISTGVMAMAQARYGYSDRALELLEKMFQSFGKSNPASISEMSPDYGCFVQAWTTYAAVTPIVRYFFGINPCAANNVVLLRPHPPLKWQQAKLENVRALQGELSISFQRKNGEITYEIENKLNSRLLFQLPPVKLINYEAGHGAGNATGNGSDNVTNNEFNNNNLANSSDSDSHAALLTQTLELLGLETALETEAEKDGQKKFILLEPGYNKIVLADEP